MPDFNTDRIRQFLGEINAALRKLGVYAGLSEDEFLANPDKVDGAKYNLIVAIECAMDICSSIAARAGGRLPRDGGDCFEVLGELDYIDRDLIDRLKKMVRFRNLLVHVYWKVDDRIVHRLLREDIEDIVRYVKTISRMLG